MSDGFTVVDGALDRHATNVDGHATTMHRVAEAARPLGLHAYGLIGQVFAATVAGTVADGSAAIRELSRGVEGIADGVRACSDAYQEADRHNASGFGGFR